LSGDHLLAAAAKSRKDLQVVEFRGLVTRPY
jgi:hypothetical protein